MEKWDLQVMARRVLSDPVFRHQFLVDPEVAMQNAGWDVPPHEMADLKEWHAHLRHVTKLDELERALAKFVAAHSHGEH